MDVKLVFPAAKIKSLFILNCTIEYKTKKEK